MSQTAGPSTIGAATLPSDFPPLATLSDRLVDGLPSLGDHHTNGPRVSPDGRWLVDAVGTVRFRVTEWLPEEPYPLAMVEALEDDDLLDPAREPDDVVRAARQQEVLQDLDPKTLPEALRLGEEHARDAAQRDQPAVPAMAGRQIQQRSEREPVARQRLDRGCQVVDEALVGLDHAAIDLRIDATA